MFFMTSTVKWILWIIIIAALAFFGYTYLAPRDNGEEPPTNTSEGSFRTGGEETNSPVPPEESIVLGEPGGYQAYSPAKLAWAEGEGRVVLFFRANWCPTCRGLDADIKANSANIPKGITILDVDYDRYADLKQKYGVTYQHTLVEVDGTGEAVSKWAGSPTLTALLERAG